MQPSPPLRDDFNAIASRRSWGRAAKHSLGPWEVFGRCWQGSLLIERRDVDRGVPLLRAALQELRQGRLFALYDSGFLCILAEGLAEAGHVLEGRREIDQGLKRCEASEELWCIAELLRIKGELSLQEPGDVAAAEQSLLQSIEWARRQEALSWELRSVTSLARLHHRQGRSRQAREILGTMYRRFGEGFETADLRAARALLDAWG